MWTLAAETSTATGSVALFKGHALVQETKWDKENTHSERITLEAEKILNANNLTFAQIDRYAVGVGPGSFTGIRVAVNFIRSLAFVFDKPVVAVDSLLLLAAPTLAQGLDVFVMQGAFRNFVYSISAEGNSAGGSKHKIILQPSALTIEELPKAITKPVLVLGKGYNLFEQHFPPELKQNIKRNPQFPDIPLAGNFQFLGLLDQQPAQQLRWNATKPLYIRASEAEEKLRQSVRK